MFQDARDFAIEQGILVNTNGKASIADPLPNIPTEMVVLRYKIAVRQEVEEMVSQVREVRGMLARLSQNQTA
jgi:hypothetical protein